MLLLLLLPALALTFALLVQRDMADATRRSSERKTLLAVVLVALVVAAAGTLDARGGEHPWYVVYAIFAGLTLLPTIGVYLGGTSTMARESWLYWLLLVPFGGFAGFCVAFWIPMAVGIDH